MSSTNEITVLLVDQLKNQIKMCQHLKEVVVLER